MNFIYHRSADSNVIDSNRVLIEFNLAINHSIWNVLASQNFPRAFCIKRFTRADSTRIEGGDTEIKNTETGIHLFRILNASRVRKEIRYKTVHSIWICAWCWDFGFRLTCFLRLMSFVFRLLSSHSNCRMTCAGYQITEKYVPIEFHAVAETPTFRTMRNIGEFPMSLGGSDDD